MRYDHLIGLPFKHGSRDCYELIRDFYRDNFDIELRSYARPDNWWKQGLNLYMDNFEREGFKSLDISPKQLQPGDLIFMAIRSTVANHAAIYVGDGKILHHYYGRLSTVELYNGIWRNCTVAYLRHSKISQVKFDRKTVDLFDLLPAHIREKLKSASRDHAPAGIAGGE